MSVDTLANYYMQTFREGDFRTCNLLVDGFLENLSSKYNEKFTSAVVVNFKNHYGEKIDERIALPDAAYDCLKHLHEKSSNISSEQIYDLLNIFSKNEQSSYGENVFAEMLEDPAPEYVCMQIVCSNLSFAERLASKWGISSTPFVISMKPNKFISINGKNIFTKSITDINARKLDPIAYANMISKYGIKGVLDEDGVPVGHTSVMESLDLNQRYLPVNLDGIPTIDGTKVGSSELYFAVKEFVSDICPGLKSKFSSIPCFVKREFAESIGANFFERLSGNKAKFTLLTKMNEDNEKGLQPIGRAKQDLLDANLLATLAGDVSFPACSMSSEYGICLVPMELLDDMEMSAPNKIVTQSHLERLKSAPAVHLLGHSTVRYERTDDEFVFTPVNLGSSSLFAAACDGRDISHLDDLICDLFNDINKTYQHKPVWASIMNHIGKYPYEYIRVEDDTISDAVRYLKKNKFDLAGEYIDMSNCVYLKQDRVGNKFYRIQEIANLVRVAGWVVRDNVVSLNQFPDLSSAVKNLARKSVEKDYSSAYHNLIAIEVAGLHEALKCVSSESQYKKLKEIYPENEFFEASKGIKSIAKYAHKVRIDTDFSL